MRLAIVGPPQSGKTALFAALTGEPPGADAAAGRTAVKVVKVPDARLDTLAQVYKPKKYTPAAFEAVDFGSSLSREQYLAAVRETDGLLICVAACAKGAPPLAKQLEDLETEWALADLAIAEKRVEKLRVQVKKPTQTREKDQEELTLVERLAAALGSGKPLREVPIEPREELTIRQYAFLTLKPRIVVENVGEDRLPYPEAEPPPGAPVPVCAKLEAELAELPPEERQAFLADLGIREPARDRLVRHAYRTLGLQSFLTAGEDEVRAWTVPVGTKAPRAAGTIHTDFERGFIRAEVVAYDDFVASGGTLKAAKAKNRVRLEGKDYVVRDGDIIEFRFSV